MPIVAPPNPETRQIVTVITDLEVRMKAAEAGLRAAQLDNASLQGSGLNVYDETGAVRTRIGRQSDGSYTATSLNNPNPPPVPSSPIVISAIASLIVRHTGETKDGSGWPADLDHLNIYYTEAQNPQDWGNWHAGGSLGTGWPEELPISPLEYTEYLVVVTAVNHSGKESAPSDPVSGTPSQVVPADLIQGWMDSLALSANSVTEAAIQANAVTTTKIADNSVSSPKVIAGAILSAHIAADQIDGGKLTAQAITARELAALSVTANAMAANAVTVGTIQAGAVTAIKLEANLILGSRIVAGSSTGNRVELHPTQGIQAFSAGGSNRTFWLDAATGNALLIGEIRTAVAGTRIVMNPGGANPDRIQFWPDDVGGVADFAYIDSFPDGAVDTGITMQSSGGQTSKVGTIWLRRAYAAIGIADNGLGAGSQFYAEPNFVRCRSATIDLMVDQALTAVNGPRRIAMLNVDTSNNPVINSSLFYGTATANQYPILYKPEFNMGLIFDGGGYFAFVHNDATYSRAIVEASEFRVSSDSTGKHSIGNFAWSALDVVRGNPARKWKRVQGEGQGVQHEHVGPQRAIAQRPDGTTKFTPTTLPKDDGWQFGPMADNMPEDLVYIDPDTGARKLGVVSMIGVLWKAVEELSAEVKRLSNDRK